MKTFIAAFLMLFSSVVMSAEVCAKTDVGQIVLSNQTCDIKFEAPGSEFKYDAYATELVDGKVIKHPGCWYGDEGGIYILFPELTLDNGNIPISVYNPDIFHKCSEI